MIDYESQLNPAQLEAVTTLEGPVLVIAGAGSGKTRTIVYRLARLVEAGVPASSILLLTFTRKAAHQMLERARRLMGETGMPALSSAATQGGAGQALGLSAVQGGTFHAYAYSVLRLFQPEGYAKNLTVMDSHDILSALQHCREALRAGKGDRSFPKNQTISGLLSKSRNKEASLEDIVRRDAPHLMSHVEAMALMADAYGQFKREKSLLDYDDLLFALEEVLASRPEALAYCRRRHQYIMVDEYQDTNPVQARLAGLVAGLDPAALAGGGTGSSPQSFSGNIMVVGDDAQSIYAFRGAEVRNILHFPKFFPGTRIIRLEENYRSTQPILDLSNAVLEHASEGYGKKLFTRREGSLKPGMVRPLSDRTEASLVVERIRELLRVYPPHEIAVLFRAGFHSYAVEVLLNKLGVAFRKYGGIRYTEAAHIKDAMSFVRLALNPLDFTAFARVAEFSKGVGAKTCLKIYQLLSRGDVKGLEKEIARFPELAEDLAFLDTMRHMRLTPAALLTEVLEHYASRLEFLYPDDYPRRMQGLEELVHIASMYSELDLFIADLSLEDPMQEEDRGGGVVLSTVHSAKGLEWSAVLILDLVEERFPSRHALVRPEDFEEERRLMYVACTRAKDYLELYVPAAVYDKGSGGSILARPSPFVRELSPDLYVEWQEGYTGGLVRKERVPAKKIAAADGKKEGRESTGVGGGFFPDSQSALGDSTASRAAPPPEEGLQVLNQGRAPAVKPSECGFCRHRIFGRGKIVQHLPPDKYRVNFPGVGLKVIMAAYLTLEDEA